jgi:putative redox protein
MPTSEKVTFKNAQGHALDARLDMPEGEARAWALFAHCFTCSKDVFAAARISRALAARGVGVLRFDFTGLGASEGEFANTDFSSNVADLEAACAHMAEQGRPVSLLVGHSLGGAAVLAAALRLESVRAVTTINAPCGPAHLSRLFTDHADAIRDNGEAEVEIGGRPFTITRDFLDDIEEHALLDGIGHMKKALLIFHAPRDEVVGIDNATRIFTSARHPKSFVSLDDADHLLSRREDAVYVADVIAAWAGRYISEHQEQRDEPAAEKDKSVGPRHVLVEETGKGKFQQSIQVGPSHHLTADEPVTVGGNDSGPGPYDFLLAGLGACTSMTIRLYAAHKKIPLDRVSVRLSHEKRHVEDCESCGENGGKLDHIDRWILLEGDLDDATRQRLMEIADRCPVHRTLHEEIRITTRAEE